MLAVLDIEKASTERSSGDVTFRLDVPRVRLLPGAAVAVTGRSGAGKSTLLDLVALARAPNSAVKLQVVGEDAAALWRKGATNALARLRARHYGYVLQTGGLVPYLTVGANAKLAQSISGKRDQARIESLSMVLGLEGLLGRMPHTLSVGQRQRAAILRALAHRPRLVLADEPTASVHPDMASAILNLLTWEAREEGAAVLLATHDAPAARAAGFAELPLTPLSGSYASALPVLECA